ncbi:hypothetical protein HT134_44395, partial [Nonomuraea rhodomycinica]|nr:hypothetical protein [Nonomuraea rhodomycinica]
TFGHHFIQVSPAGPAEHAGYEVEYKEGHMVRTLMPRLEDVRPSFHEYATGDRSVLARHDWSS